MQTPPPDPGRLPAAQPAAAGAPAPAGGSTGSHRNVPDSLSDVLRSQSSSVRTPPSAASVVSHLPLPAADPDDAPTVITKNNASPPPPPPHVVGDAHSVAGRRLGHFELIEAIGAGGMAAVLKARDTELGRIVALKILPPESALDPENVNRFKQEARAAAKLDHDNVARVYFCGEDQGLHFIAFEFVEGITLRQTIDWRGPVPPADCVRYMIQVAAGLAHAADRGVVHRDIKPSNILITPDGKAKIVDMGLARHLESQSVNGGVTQSGVTLGTFDYISPEQALDPRVADVRSDIYSLGCTFYHALTGRPPVPEGTAAKKLHAHQHIDPLDPRELNPNIPDELAAILARMMAKDPKRRYQTPAELIAHLKAVAERLRIPLETVVTDSTVQALPADDRMLPAMPRVRLSWVAAAAGAVAAVVAIAVAAGGPEFTSAMPWWASNGSPKNEPPVEPNPPANNTVEPIAPVEKNVSTADGLVKALADAKTTRVRLSPGEYDLTKLGKGAAFKGSQLELIGSVSPSTTIRLSRSLALAAASLKVQGIRFEITGEPIGLAIQDATSVEFTDCQFAPDADARKAGAVAVNIDGPEGEPLKVNLSRCLFAPGWIGIRVPSHASVEVFDSGFAPHSAAIQVREPAEPPSEPVVTAIRLERSSFMLDGYSAAVDTDGDVKVSAGYCVFASANGPIPDGKAAPESQTLGTVIRTARKSRSVKLAMLGERRNAYYSVTPQFPLLKGMTFDEGWLKLDRRPWDPTGGVLSAFTTNEPWTAFRLTLTGPAAETAVFLPGNEIGVIGAQFHDQQRGNVRRAYASSVAIWPPSRPPAAEITTRVWWPNGPADRTLLPANTETDIVRLLRDARSGDTILIRHTGLLPIDQPLVLPARKGAGDRSTFHLTFKPATKDDHPILTPAAVNQREFSLFVLREGRVTFEGLHFAVKPGEAGAQDEGVSAVNVLAGRECIFRNCTFTLDEEGTKYASIVTMSDAGKEMKMEGPAMSTPPRIEFEACLIRGKGRALSVPQSRPFALDMQQSITALDGPVVFAKTAGRDVGPGAAASIHLSRVTALLGGPFIELQGGAFGAMRASGLVQTSVTADRCLFAAVSGAGQPMVEVEGTDLDRMDPNRVLTWKSTDTNRFVNFEPTSPIVVVKPDGGTAQSWTWTEWLPFARVAGRPVGKVTFAEEPKGLKDLAAVKPRDVEVKGVEFPDLTDAKPGDAGADPTEVATPPDAMRNETAPEPELP